MYYLKGIIIAIYCLLCFDLIPHSHSMPPKKGSYQKRKISTDVVEVALAGFASVVGASFQLTEDKSTSALVKATFRDVGGNAVLVNGPGKRPRVDLRVKGDFCEAFDSGQLNEAGTAAVILQLQTKLAPLCDSLGDAADASLDSQCSSCSGMYGDEGHYVHDNCTGRICTECFKSQIENHLAIRTNKEFECLFENCKAPLSYQTILDHLPEEATSSAGTATLKSRCIHL
jgi:hypothetical protein